ncbi:MAG: iron export ABC transporter permease subunit FetB [Nitrospinota bacterium]|nr:iron export ABC transporter permease subunit FetB [Nitrospinota bacterium]
MNSVVIDPSALDLAMVALLFGIVIALSIKEQLGIEKTFLHAAVRCVVQLLLVGYIIEYIFALNRWYFVVLLIITMSVIAATAGSQRMTSRVKNVGLYVWFAIFTGTIVNTFIVTEVILKIEPWYDPRYLLPLAGMIMGNALNSGSMAGERFLSELKNRKAEVETMLILGHSSTRACIEMKRSAVRATLIPTFNAMFTVGFVHLPGMMTGQILGGASPVVAAKYQIIVMFMISSTVLLTALILINLLKGKYFTKAHQLNYHLL